MPYSQPQDADQEFYTDFNVSWTFNNATTPVVTSVVAPPGVQFVRLNTGLFQLSVPSVYIAALNTAGTPFTSAEFFPVVHASTAGATDTAYIMRYMPLGAGTSLSLGTFEFATSLMTVPQTPADVPVAYPGSMLCKFKFATVLVMPS